MKNVLIRCDASKKIGLGHVVRCLALAKRFKKEGFNVIFAMKEELGISKVDARNYIVERKALNSSYEEWIKQIVDVSHINVFIGDIRDGFPISVIKYMNQKSILTVAIDEPSEYAKECDLCFYPPHAKIDKSLYKGKVFQGLKYVILRDEFYENFQKKENEIPNVLVMMGGTDANDLSLKIIEVLISYVDKINIKIILNQNNKNYDLIKNMNKVSIYSKVDNMAQFLCNIDYAIVSFGMSLYEMLIMKIPSINICLEEEHYINSEYFEKSGFSKSYKVSQVDKIDLESFFSMKNVNNKNNQINKVYDEIVRRLTL